VRIATTGLVLVGLILVVLLWPDIQRAKIGVIELEVQSYGPGDHYQAEDLTNNLTQFIREGVPAEQSLV
jgi:hypothetical protein